MKSFSSPKHAKKEQSFENCTTTVKNQIQTQKIPINPIIIQHQALGDEGESGGQQQGKFKIEWLCNFFMQKIAFKENYDFEARQLIENTGVKQRRIYDLMNILQGCGFIKRTSKGKYTWFGFDHNATESELMPYKHKDTTSLRNLAHKVKDLLFTNQGYLDIKDIFQKIEESNRLNQDYNPKSIRRRVYQCCKILKTMGVIEKNGHTYKWISSQQRSKNKLNLSNKNNCKYEIGREREDLLHNVFKDDRQACIVTLVKHIPSQKELQLLIMDIRKEYQTKQKYQNKQNLHLISQPRRKKLFE